MIRRKLVPLAVASLLLGMLPVLPAEAARTCRGRKATKVGTAGDDVIQGTRRADVIVALGGDDQVLSKGGDDVVCLGGGSDIALGGGGDDVLSGGSGSDGFAGQTGNDLIIGGSDSDFVSFVYSTQGITADMATGRATGEGSDRFGVIEGLFGSSHNDVLNGSDGFDIIFGDDGNDEIDAKAELDLVHGGGGNDSIDGGPGFDLLQFSQAPTAVTADLATGIATGEGTDTFANFEGVQGSEFNDTLRGDQNFNFLFGEGGNDSLDGAGGFDYAVHWFAPGPVTVDLAAGTASGWGSDVLTNVEGAVGSVGFADTLRGNDSNNYLDGDGGNDTLVAGDGNDWIYGGLGNDSIDGGPGTRDLVAFYGLAAATVDLGAGSASGEGTDTLANVEEVQGTNFADTLIGSSADNLFYALGGDDTVSGGDGADLFDGGDGVDTFDGGPGNDGCTRAETVTSCETATEPPLHPLFDDVQSFDNFRRAH